MDRFHDKTVVGKPLPRSSMDPGHVIRAAIRKSILQEIRKQWMKAVPLTLIIQWKDKQVGVVEEF